MIALSSRRTRKGPRSERAKGEHVHEAFRQIPPCVRRTDGGRAGCGVWPFQASRTRLMDRRKRARRSTEGRPLRRHQHRLGQADQCHRQSRRGSEAASQVAGNRLPSGPLSRGAGDKLAHRAAARPANHNEGQRQRTHFHLSRHPGATSDSGACRRPVRAFHAADRAGGSL